MDLDLSTQRLGERAVVSVGGEVDLETASQLGDAALDALREVSPHVVLDLAGVTFMDSTGLKVLLTIHRRAELAGGSFAVAAAARPVRRVLTLTGLDQTFALYDTVEEALVAGSGTTAATASATGSAAEPTA
jgi:anti-anti-sigma factor